MRSTITLLASILVMSSIALAQPRRRAPAAPTRDAAVAVDASTSPDADAGASRPAEPAAPTCCCRAWSHGWQYAWRTESDCGAQNGTCVSPDHC
ncbi:MAG: hypothetical protein R3A48_14155 [Polyangiales bacterium]